jgi:hypothetical protein
MCYDLLTRTLLYKYNDSSTISTNTIHNISITTILHKLHVLFVTLLRPSYFNLTDNVHTTTMDLNTFDPVITTRVHVTPRL